jgi:predicted ribosomally synthesized peptide with SipW-like signal peptide
VIRTPFGGTGRKVLLSLGALGVAGALAGMGTFATFTATTSASQTLGSGTVIIALPTAGTATNRLTIGATGLVPGDTVQRAVDLTNTGSQGLASITLSTAASPSTLLDTDATNGLQMVVDRCSVAWSESGASPAFTYTCGGTTTTPLTTRPVTQSGFTLLGLSALTAGSTDHLRVTLTLPSVAIDTLQGKSSTITYTFNATQRAGTSQ